MNKDIVVTQAGTVIDSVDVHGYIKVQAANVKIVNSIVRGRSDSTTYRPLIDNRQGFSNLVVENTLIAEDVPSPWNASGIGGSNFTARGVTIVGQIDSINITGSNVLIEGSTLRDTVVWADHWQSQASGPTHNDNIQVLRGDNITIRNNRIYGSENFAVLGAPEWGSMNNLRVENNYVDGGICTMKFSSKGGYSHSVTATGNRFGPNHSSYMCELVIVEGANVNASGNVRDATGEPVRVQRPAS